MYEDKHIEYLKRSLKKTYKRYIGERTDEEASLTDVAKFFKIPIDETRLQDYVIKHIDYKEKFSIELTDVKENITYNADYYYSYFDEMYLLSVKSSRSQGKTESFYCINDDEPFDSNMVIINEDGYKLKFRRQRPNLRPANCLSNRFTVNYLDNTNNKNKEDIILTKVFAKHTKEEIQPNLDAYQFGATYLSDLEHRRNRLSEYCYIKESDGVIYNIEKFCKDSSITYLKGLYCEKLDNIEEYISSYELDKTPTIYKILSDKNNDSAIIIACKIDNGSRFSHRNTLTISKNKEKIVIEYDDFDLNNVESNTFSNRFKKVNFPILSDGRITIEEINNVIETLSEMVVQDEFLDVVKGELNNFMEQLNTRDILVDEQVDPLEPKLLIDKSFDEIYNMISANKEYYFKLISEQVESADDTPKKDSKKLLKRL